MVVTSAIIVIVEMNFILPSHPAHAESVNHYSIPGRTHYSLVHAKLNQSG